LSPAVALLHGFTGWPASWDAVVAALPPGTRVAAPPLVGHGAEARGPRFEDEVDRLAAELRKAADRVHLAGYSLGGRLALGLMVRHPDLVLSAMLVGAQPGLAADDERKARRVSDDRLRAVLLERGLEAFVDAWERLPLFASQASLPDAVLAAQRESRLRHEPGALAESLRLTGLGAMPPYGEALRAVECPTTLMAGELDPKFTALAFEMAERIPGATVEIVAGAGHNVVMERPAAVAAAIARHLGRAAE
jgi:2-succinyl-6-hydroxy-2,4-cyclohexadiene-1-carboxylate synthase